MVNQRTRFAVMALFFLEALAFSSWLPRLPEIRLSLGLDEAALGLVLMGMPAGALVVMPFAGFFSTRLDVRTLNVACMGVLMSATVLIPFATSAASLAAVLFLLGLGTGSMGVAMNAAGLAVERGLARPVLARCHAFFSIGVAAGGGVGGAMAALDVPLSVHMPALAVLVAIALAATCRHLPRGVGGGAEGPRFAWPTRALAVPAAIAFFCLFAEGAALDWSAIHLRDTLGADALVGSGLVAFGAAMALARFFGDAVVARLGTVASVSFGAVIAATGFFAAAFASSAPLAVGGFALAGLGLAGIVPIAFRTAGSQPDVAPGIGVAAVSTIGYVGFLAGPPAMGFMADRLGMPLAFGAVALAMIVVAALAPLLSTRSAAGTPREVGR